MSRLTLYLLGPPRIELDGTPVQIHRRKAMALLAYLAVAGSSHSREKLATLLWPGSEQSRAFASLRVVLAALNSALGEGWLQVDREKVSLNASLKAHWHSKPGKNCDPAMASGRDLWLDVDAFRDRLAAYRTHDHPPEEEVCPACLSTLTEAAALYADDFLAGFTLPDSPAYDEWQFFQCEGLRQQLASVLERLARGLCAQGAYGPAISHARRWVSLDVLHEPAHRALMQLYARSGQHAAALRQYAECERILREELGAPPEEETTHIYQAIREKRLTSQPASPPGDRPAQSPSEPGHRQMGLDRPFTNLPTQISPFVGRQDQLAEVRALLARPEVRLLTLTGAGGTGKTRLAVEAVARLLEVYPDGVFYVALAPVSDPALVLPAVATALGVREFAGRSPIESLQHALRDKQLLLVADNLEHLLPAAPALAELLSAAPRLKILATSQAPLQMYAEFEYEVPPMVTPGAGDLPPLEHLAQVEAVQLFIQRVRAVRADFVLGEENALAVAEICVRLGGLPLAIELAAAWGRMLAPAEILTELGHGLDFLESERRDVPERQRSMRAVFDHSWRLLSPHEREVLRAASVFRGGFTRRAAEQVADASLRDLRSLVARSLLQRVAALRQIQDSALGQTTLDPRYEMHELFRQYAQGKLDEGPRAGEGSEAGVTARDRHCAFYSAALEGWDRALKGPDQVRALAEMGAEIGNARAAWEWAAQRGYVERLDQGMDGLCRFYEWRGRYQEGEAACRLAEGALGVSQGTSKALFADDRVRVFAKALIWRAVLGQATHHVDRVLPLLQRGLATLEQCASGGADVRREQAFALWQMADASHAAGQEDAQQWFEHSLALYRALGDRWGVAQVLHRLGGKVLGIDNAFQEGEAMVRESLAIRQALGDERGIALSRRALAITVCLQGGIEECERLFRQSLAAFQAVGDPVDTAHVLTNLAYALLFLGRPDEAYVQASKSDAILRELGIRDQLAATTQRTRGDAALWLGRYPQARRFTEAGLAVAREIGRQNPLSLCLRSLAKVEIIEENYARAAQLLREGFAAVWRARNHNAYTCMVLLGLTALREGQPDQARRHVYEGLGAALDQGSCFPLLYGLPVAAALLLEEGEVERAVELYALALEQPFVASSRWYEDVVGRHIAAAAETLSPEVVSAAQRRGRARDLWATVRELVAELGEEPTT